MFILELLDLLLIETGADETKGFGIVKGGGGGINPKGGGGGILAEKGRDGYWLYNPNFLRVNLSYVAEGSLAAYLINL